MNASDKKEIIDTFEEISERHFLLAKLETLVRIKKNLQSKIVEIDNKIIDLKKTYGIEDSELLFKF
ncbi:MAG: hypothetical protein ACTSVI_04850 [Promethearchaeota archaeon]